MSPSGQSNLLLIRRLLHPSTCYFDPIRGRYFAQVLPKFLVVRSHRRDCASAHRNAWSSKKDCGAWIRTEELDLSAEFDDPGGRLQPTATFRNSKISPPQPTPYYLLAGRIASR